MPITATTVLDTAYGPLTVNYHEGDAGACASFVLGDPSASAPLLLRLHSACLFGEAIGARECDCATQLTAALQRIADDGRGVLLYLFQEGRGVGLRDKIRAMELQRNEGLDTVAAMKRLGLVADARTYEQAVHALHDLGVQGPLRLISNNPNKHQALIHNGFTIVETVRMIYDVSDWAYQQLRDKVDLLGHTIDFDQLLRIGPEVAAQTM